MCSRSARCASERDCNFEHIRVPEQHSDTLKPDKRCMNLHMQIAQKGWKRQGRTCTLSLAGRNNHAASFW